MRQFNGFAILLCLVVACGGEDSKPTLMVNSQNAALVATQFGNIRQSIQASNGAGAVGAAVGLSTLAQTILAPPQATRTASSPQLETVFAAMRASGEIAAADAGTCTCTPTGCTFNMCGSAGYTINGSIGISGDTYTFDLRLTGSIAGVTWNYTYAGSLTVSATMINGSFSSMGDGTIDSNGSHFEYSFDTSLDINAITLDASGCAIGGSLTIEVDYSVSGTNTGGSGSYSGRGTATFGPTCGAVQ